MKKISQLFPHVSKGNKIESVHNDSRDVNPDSLFIAYTGYEVDGHLYILNAYEKGCRFFLVDQARIPEFEFVCPLATFIGAEDLKKESARVILEFYDHPDQKLCLIGVTGTNGKTTTATLINKNLQALGCKTAFFGTVEWTIDDMEYPATNTTPDLLKLVTYMHLAVFKGVTHVIMEVSSHAIELGRVELLNFDYAMFTNLTQDHLDFHHTMDSYYTTKAKLFLTLLANSVKSPKKAIINADNEYGQKILHSLGGRGIPSDSLSLEGLGVWNAIDIELSIKSSKFVLECGDEKIKVETPLLGKVNVQNAMMAFVLLRHLGFTADVILPSLQKTEVPGRLQKIEAPNGAVFLVDYAHTPDALAQIIESIKATLEPYRRVIVVFGAGGDRDKTKRPLMAKAAAKADLAVVTSDNPRTEDPMKILEDISKGFSETDHVFEEIDRQKALVLAYEFSNEGDAIIVAGKGHEDYQIIGKTKHHFSDVEEILKLCNGA